MKENIQHLPKLQGTATSALLLNMGDTEQCMISNLEALATSAGGMIIAIATLHIEQSSSKYVPVA
jgi:hypothetical protein